MERTTDGSAIVRTCTSGLIRFNLPERNVFGGETSQGFLIIVEMNATRRRVLRLRWMWDAPCVLGPAARPDTTTATTPNDVNFPVDARGRWGASFVAGPFSDPATGTTVRYAYRIVAVRAGQTMKGTIASTLTETDTASGQVIDTCASGAVRFRTRTDAPPSCSRPPRLGVNMGGLFSAEAAEQEMFPPPAPCSEGTDHSIESRASRRTIPGCPTHGTAPRAPGEHGWDPLGEEAGRGNGPPSAYRVDPYVDPRAELPVSRVLSRSLIPFGETALGHGP